MATHEEQIAILTDKLNALENESRKILRALRWSTKVRLILSFSLLLFALISGLMFYWLYVDIKTNRVAEVQRIITENPQEFSEPLTKQVMLLAEEQGPFVVDVFRKQAQNDSPLYLKSFDDERATLINNLQGNLETKLANSYSAMLVEQEQLLMTEFPVLKDQEKLQNVRNNMEKVYEKIGQRYFVDSLRDELDDIVDTLDTFPLTNPKQNNVPLGEQIASEFLELVRMMMVNSGNYVVPAEDESIGTISTSTRATGDDPTDDVAEDDNAEADAAKDDDAKDDAAKDDATKDDAGESDDSTQTGNASAADEDDGFGEGNEK